MLSEITAQHFLIMSIVGMMVCFLAIICLLISLIKIMCRLLMYAPDDKTSEDVAYAPEAMDSVRDLGSHVIAHLWVTASNIAKQRNDPNSDGYHVVSVADTSSAWPTTLAALLREAKQAST